MSRCIRFGLLLLVSAPVWAQSDPPPPPPSVAKLAREAGAARDANRPEEALKLYQQAVRVAPKWKEGWWHIGAIQYGLDQYEKCREAFRRFVAIDPSLSAGFAFLGLCEFQTKEFGPALEHLEKGFSLGLPNDQQLSDVAIYHTALLQTKAGNFERGLLLCRILARKGLESPELVAIAGIASLRRPIFPHELPPEDRAVTFKLGAAMLAGGQTPVEEVLRRLDEVATEYPNTPNVNYSYATVLLAQDPDKAVNVLKRELEISPDHLPSLVSLAFEYLKRGEPDNARPYAEKAARLAPGSFAARTCFGRVLLESSDADIPNAILELEAAAKLAPDSPQVQFSLASAYARAGRKQDAAKARAEFSRLKSLGDSGASKEVK